MNKNFYKVLGIDQKAGPEKIKKAFRQAAKRYHPDVSPKDEEKFKEVQEAYETLSDPEKKAAYDREILKKRTPVAQPRSFRPSPGFSSTLFDAIDPFFERFEGSWMDIESHFWDEWEPKHSDLYVEIILTRSEARKGGKIPLQVRFWADCRRCGGTGYVTGLICGWCRGRGKEKMEKSMSVTIPSGVKDGMRLTIPVTSSDLRTIHLIATLRVSKSSIRS